MEQIFLIILGSILALGTSLAVEAFKGFITDRRYRKLLGNLLSNEIPTILATIDRLIIDSDRLRFIPIIGINQIYAARQGYDRNRDWIILFPDETLRRDIVDFYMRLSETCQEASGNENLILQPQQQAEFNELVIRRRPELIAIFRDIQVRGRDILQRINRQ